jgi:hypothetical protein
MRNAQPSKVISVIGVLLMSSMSFATDVNGEAIEEATGLSDEVSTESPSEAQPSIVPSLASPSESGLGRTRTRAYILIDGTKASGSEDDQVHFPNGQLSFSGDYKIQNDSFVLVDALGNYDANKKEGSSFLNQAGFRSRVSETVQYFIGKERNRRSPGLIVSPSDFIYSNTNLPGQREDRRGVWLGRVSYQVITGSADVLVLPVQTETSEGLPQSNQSRTEGAVRGMYQFNGFDLSLMAGRYLGINRAGASIQTLFANKYKIYVEHGTQDEVTVSPNTTKAHPSQTLLGFGYEGSEDFSLRFEYFHNGQGLDSEEFNRMMRLRSLFPNQLASGASAVSPFVRQKYLISSLSFPELQKKYNVTVSGIKCLEDDSILALTRLEYIGGDKILVGLSYTQIQGGTGSQFQYRSFNSQTTLDFKYSF